MMPNMLTIRQAVERLKADGLPLSEYALRLLVKRGAIPVRYRSFGISTGLSVFPCSIPSQGGKIGIKNGGF